MKTKVGLMKGLINLSSFTNKKKKKKDREKRGDITTDSMDVKKDKEGIL